MYHNYKENLEVEHSKKTKCNCENRDRQIEEMQRQLDIQELRLNTIMKMLKEINKKLNKNA